MKVHSNFQIAYLCKLLSWNLSCHYTEVSIESVNLCLLIEGATGLSQFHPSNSFGYLLDVLDGGEPGDEIEPAPEFFGSKQTR